MTVEPVVLEEERLAALALQSIQGIGPTYAKRLIEAAGSFKKVFDLEFDESNEREGGVLVPSAYLRRIRSQKSRAFETAEERLNRAKKLGIQVVVLTEPEYPSRLKEIPDPPSVLYIYGEAEAPDELCLGVVGTRKATESGLKFARDLGYELASAGINIVSGLALGVDTAAHEGALEAEGGRTWAVLGTGTDVCYPPRNRRLYERIIRERRGVIVSEYGPGTQPEAHHFPIRNRIISGLSLGVVVVEAPERSGALITAQYAAEQGRDVFAVPHPARSVCGAGTNRLIREGAHLIEKIEDILSVIEQEARRMIGRAPSVRPASPANPVARPGSSAVYDLIQSGVGGLDELVVKSGLEISNVLAEVTRLEIEGRICRVAAGSYRGVGSRRP